MPKKKNIYIFDLHNTLYDEVLEYGTAMAEAVDYLLLEAGKGASIDENLFYQQLSQAHARCGSDWDDDAFLDVPELQKIADFESHVQKAARIRRRVSREWTEKSAYKSTIKAIKSLKSQGHHVYITTEGTQNAVADALFWLGLDGVVDAVYSWPYPKSFVSECKKTPLKTFPDYPKKEGTFAQKPHPAILGNVFLEHAKRDGKIPMDVNLEDVFDFSMDPSVDVSALENRMDQITPEVRCVLDSIGEKMTVKQSACADILNDVKSRCYYIGDSHFKDGYLALNAGVPFVFAAYGKAVQPGDKAMHQRASQILQSVTGWSKALMRLTQDASEISALTDRIDPIYICEKGFDDFIAFQERGSEGRLSHRLVRANVKDLVPYQSARGTVGVRQDMVFMDAAENPWSPFDEGSLAHLNRYPAPQPESLIEGLAALYDVMPNEVLVTRGSEEAIRLLMQTFCTPQKDSILTCPPTFAMYDSEARVQDVSNICVPRLGASHDDLDLEKISSTLNQAPDIKLVFLCNPGNPSSAALPSASIESLLELTKDKCFVIVDEAYIEFAAHESFARKLSVYDNLIVLRTLSKSYGLAGLRCGSIIAAPDVIDYVRRVLAPYPLPRPTIEIALKALASDRLVKMQDRQKVLINERAFIIDALKTCDYIIKIYPSQTNFLCVTVGDAAACVQFFYENGIVIRDRSRSIPNSVNIAVGKREQNTKVLELFQKLSENLDERSVRQ